VPASPRLETLPNLRPWTAKWPADADILFQGVETPIEFQPLSVGQRNAGRVLTEAVPDLLEEIHLLLRRQVVEVDRRSSHGVFSRYGRCVARQG